MPASRRPKARDDAGARARLGELARIAAKRRGRAARASGYATSPATRR